MSTFISFSDAVNSCIKDKSPMTISAYPYYEKLFDYLCTTLPTDFEGILCMSTGLVIATWPNDKYAKYKDSILNIKDLSDKTAKIYNINSLYFFVYDVENSSHSSVRHFFNVFDNLLNIFRESSAESFNLFTALDAVNKSISIYDKNANLLFANKNFCNYLYLNDRNAIIGRNIDDIIKEAGTTIQSIETNTSRLKMHEVLNEGRTVIDWEVRVTSSRGDTQLVGNDMYPIRDEKGNITGMVEITHSRRQLLANAKKLAGLSAEYTFENIIGSSLAISNVIRTAKDYANSPLSLLITGESGVGKELFAQSIHNYSNRHKGPFVALNCASFPESLIESELFGYVGGAFTGASKSGQIGKFELADGGTLFLDEVGELPFHFQSKLLRVLETWTVTRIGANKPTPINVRIIAATNRDLVKMVEEGLFRQDLYYRLQILNIVIPPLRERKDDILPLSEVLLQQGKNPDSDKAKTLTYDAKSLLTSYNWPGNVRELRNVLYRASLLSKSDYISSEILESSISANGTLINSAHSTSSATSEERLKHCKDDVNRAYTALLQEAVDISGGNKSKAAELLNISRNTFYRMLKKYHLD